MGNHDAHAPFFEVFPEYEKLTLALAVAACFASGDFEIEWDKPVNLGAGGYARIHRLSDGRYMLAYGRGANMAARYSRKGASGKWSKPQTVAKHFVATNGTESGWVRPLRFHAVRRERMPLNR